MPIRSLSLLALVFVLIFALELVGVLLPFQPLDPTWQWRLSNALIQGAMLPLLALALLLIAGRIDPVDLLIKRRRQIFSHLAVAAAIGFLLLLPLQLSAGLRLQKTVGSAQLKRINDAEQRLALLRQATISAISNTELNANLQKLSGPVLLGSADLSQPLPLLKAQVKGELDQAQIQINRDRAKLPPATPATILPELLHNGLSCLVLTVAYAAFARRAGSDLSLLEEARQRLRRLGPNSRGQHTAEAYYIRRLSGEED
ncbi:MAG: HpsJ family protein [Cyanobacteriota bacterium]|jgi:hypothetical protein